MVYSIFTSMKVFSDPWVGHPGLNRLGLHRRRMRWARGCAALRRGQTVRARSPAEEELLDQGCIAVENFLPEEEFAALSAEAHEAAAAAARSDPPPEPKTRGFGDPVDHDWGFDRFDGATLNRFIYPGPRALAFARHPQLRRFARLVTGRRLPPGRVQVYQTVNGDDSDIRDIQREFHRDTFFAALKYWFFLDPVREEDGPMTYVPESHRLTRERIAWEEAKAAAAVAARERGDRYGMTGSFRIGEDELAGLGLPAPRSLAVPANTLVVANVFGFHRRGDAEPGTRRLALYGNHRPQPFNPFGS